MVDKLFLYIQKVLSVANQLTKNPELLSSATKTSIDFLYKIVIIRKFYIKKKQCVFVGYVIKKQINRTPEMYKSFVTETC